MCIGRFIIFLFFLFLFLVPADCPRIFQNYSDVIDKLKWISDVQPKVIEDATKIRDKFPCNEEVLEFLTHVVSNFWL